METIQTKPEELDPQVQPEEEAPAFQAPKKKRKWRKRLIIALVLVAAIFFLLIRPMLSTGQQLLALTYLSDTAQIRDMTVQVSSTGTVTPIDSYRVNALATGEVVEAPFEEDEWVEEGQLLYRIDSSDADNTIQRSQLSVEQAQLSYNAALEGMTPTSNVSGVVQTLHVKVGDSVTVGSPIADILDSSTMTISIPFHSTDAASFYVGQQGTLTVDGTLETITGTIQSISGADEVGTGGVLLRQVEFRVNNPGALTPERSATAMVGSVACAGSGTFEYAVQKTVSAATSGDITALYVSAGDRVSNGTVLCSIGGTAAENTLANARIALETAQLTLESALDALDNYTITAPISGTVVEKNFKEGDNIDSTTLSTAGGSLAVIYDMSTLTFEMNINELDINKIQVGQEVTITASAVEGQTFTGVVDTVSINGTTVSGMTTYPITVRINDPGDLKPGMNVSADVIVERVGQVLCVPVEAVNRGGEQPYVLVAGEGALDENGNVADVSKLERREVTLGRNDDSYIEITGGLAEGEIVVWENQVSNPLAALVG